MPTISSPTPLQSKRKAADQELRLADKDPEEDVALVSEVPQEANCGLREAQTKAVDEKNQESLAWDADKPLPEYFRGRYGTEPGQLPPRLYVKKLLFREMKSAYPRFDYLMLTSMIENYLDHPEDTPEKLLERAPKLPISPPPVGDQQKQDLKETNDLGVEGPPGGRGILQGDPTFSEDENNDEHEYEEGDEEIGSAVDMDTDDDSSDFSI